MARWKLTQPHYLNVPGTKWEYTENSRTNGKPIRKQYDVPQYLHPDDPSDWTEVEMTDQRGNAVQGIIVVCHEGKGNTKDIVFSGKPTPDMIPLDEEAKIISAKFEQRWRYKPETSEGTYSQSLVDNLQTEMAKSEALAAKPVQVEGIAELVAAIAEQTRMTGELLKRRA